MRLILVVISVISFSFTKVAGRAVNISNAWVLPEEGFPVFYRYFRDRITWNEADAVCQFHHANLVTVDSTSQYDAIRAYLKELDIANNVWIGLSRAADQPNFMWKDFRDLSKLDNWQEAIPSGSNQQPLCTATDPAADYRWHAFDCGGPETASFICELPVPAWASGGNGCLITELPSLTVLYIPEQSAVELTSDCGLEGTKQIVCKGKSDRDNLIQRLACTDDGIAVEGRTQPSTVSAKTTKPLIWTSNTIDAGDYGSATRHRRETEETASTSNGPTTEIAILENTSQLLSTSGGSTPSETEDGNHEEFASAINQGQLFSIIDNGTIFDIIELNGTEENKTSSSQATKAIGSTVSTKEALPEMLPSHTIDNENLHRTFRKQVPLFPKPDSKINMDISNAIADTQVIENISPKQSARASNAGQLSIQQSAESNYDSEPTAKPNRQRQLTRSNRRSFYPYFFSRVLG